MPRVVVIDDEQLLRTRVMMTLTRVGFSIEDDSIDQFGLFEAEEVFLSSELLISTKIKRATIW